MQSSRGLCGQLEIGGLRVGYALSSSRWPLTALLFVAAQAGFIDGRVACRAWQRIPGFHRFAQLSSRLTISDGVLLMGAAAISTLVYTRGSLTALVTMYSINVFVTFSLSQLGMLRYWLRHRETGRRKGLAIHGVAFTLCFGILIGILYEKFALGGWVTVLVTGALIAFCFRIRHHYRRVEMNLTRLDTIMEALPTRPPADIPAIDRKRPTAVLLVGGYGGMGVHALLTIQRLFPGHYRNIIFVSVGVIDVATMKGVHEVDRLRTSTKESLEDYVALAHRFGLASEYRMGMGTDVLDAAIDVCAGIQTEFPRAVFFLGKLIFERERVFQRILHNETAYQLNDGYGCWDERHGVVCPSHRRQRPATTR